ncbi:hypothetical protein E2C01_026439 [Portunus trituberculatus]|uniref:Uncharacterized protein n=1 Tax=Portunus trituberculatus TaxID=210409 RepID=A0A5B7EIK2_PORTR|nr:hypothetical protein [Portunus trituberculatus]
MKKRRKRRVGHEKRRKKKRIKMGKKRPCRTHHLSIWCLRVDEAAVLVVVVVAVVVVLMVVAATLHTHAVYLHKWQSGSTFPALF